jgi:hypothetical protein
VQPRTDLSWVPAAVPGRETKARLLAWLLTTPLAPEAVARAGALVNTATDVLRLLAVRSGGDASLIDRPRLTPVPRPLRRTLLGFLDRLGVGERLHPGEHAGAYPCAALAFAALRGTDLTAHPDGRRLAQHATSVAWVRVQQGTARVTGWAARVETALAAGDVSTATGPLAARPGEYLRRLDHLLRTADNNGQATVLDALPAAAAHVSPQVLLAALGELRTRGDRHHRRVFFPAGRRSVAHVIPDERDQLPAELVGRVVTVLEAEALRRAAALPRLVAPFAERTAARTLVTLARGSVLPVPDGRYLRLFCHWTEIDGGPRVDLDLSVALYGQAWQHIGTCDYTSLHVPGAVHSGDLTSAPPTQGASEFIDLDLARLADAGARYAVVAILSYNNVAFTDMAEAFAGVMVRAAAPERGEVFNARAVEQRFDLTGPGKLTLPFVIDLAARTMRWLDVTGKITGTHHAVHRHHELFATLVDALEEAFTAGARVTLGELARWHATARADEVLVRDGSRIARYRRRDTEPAAAFAARLTDPAAADAVAQPDDAATASLQLLVRADLPHPAGAEMFALYPAGVDPATVRLLAAAELATALGTASVDPG